MYAIGKRTSPESFEVEEVVAGRFDAERVRAGRDVIEVLWRPQEVCRAPRQGDVLVVVSTTKQCPPLALPPSPSPAPASP